MPSIRVELGDRSYPIQIEAGAFSDAGFLLSAIRGSQVVIISNEVVAPLFLSALKERLESANKQCLSIVIPDGEAQKSIQNFELVLSKMLENRISRDACVIALGGGVIGDLSGLTLFKFRQLCCLKSILLWEGKQQLIIPWVKT